MSHSPARRVVPTLRAICLFACAVVAAVFALAACPVARASDPFATPLALSSSAVSVNEELATACRQSVVVNGSTVRIKGVPGYLWRDGCAPTAMGMIMAYYDGKPGLDFLMPGDALTQTSDVNQCIASHGSSTDPRHYEDYARPLDAHTVSVRLDRSSTAPDSCHADDCLADFLHTSRSYSRLRYGATLWTVYGDGFSEYVAYRQESASYVGYSTRKTWLQGLTASLLRSEIRAGRPLLFSIDSDGDGSNDHAVAVFGYRTYRGRLQYACRDTWRRDVHWAYFRKVGKRFGVKAAYTCRVQLPNPAPTVSGIVPASVASGSAATWITISGSDFARGCTVYSQHASSPLPMTYVSSTEIKAQVPAAELTETGAILIKVANPEPGGGWGYAYLEVTP